MVLYRQGIPPDLPLGRRGDAAPHFCEQAASHEGDVPGGCRKATVRLPSKRLFDGKIGLWPVVEERLTKRKSKHRPANVLYTASVEMNKSVYKSMLFTQFLIPAIKTSWPGIPQILYSNLLCLWVINFWDYFVGARRIIIQHDNAPPHKADVDKDVKAACVEGGWDITFDRQPL